MMKDFDMEDMGKRMPYHVPEGFFEKFPERMMQKVQAERARRRRVWRIAVGTGIAALFAGVFFFGGRTGMQASSEDYVEWASALSERMDAYVSGLSDEELMEQYDYYAADVTLTLYDEE